MGEFIVCAEGAGKGLSDVCRAKCGWECKLSCLALSYCESNIAYVRAEDELVRRIGRVAQRRLIRDFCIGCRKRILVGQGWPRKSIASVAISSAELVDLP